MAVAGALVLMAATFPLAAGSAESCDGTQVDLQSGYIVVSGTAVYVYLESNGMPGCQSGGGGDMEVCELAWELLGTPDDPGCLDVLITDTPAPGDCVFVTNGIGTRCVSISAESDCLDIPSCLVQGRSSHNSPLPFTGRMAVSSPNGDSERSCSNMAYWCYNRYAEFVPPGSCAQIEATTEDGSGVSKATRRVCS